MTPAARVQASIEILDDILAGSPVEKSLTGWARRSRFAGSKDRAAIRDHVFDALRCMRSFAALGGSNTGRGLMIGAMRALDRDPSDVFTGERYAPDALTEKDAARAFESEAERLDIPEWLWPEFLGSLAGEAETTAHMLQTRAPIHLRVNLVKSDLGHASRMLATEGIETRPHPLCDTALEVTAGSRKIAQSAAYLNGLVELQDAASQAVVAELPLRPGMRVLDFCAGGGGKALALAARADGLEVFAHDKSPNRMKGLPARARRAGASIRLVTSEDATAAGPFDIVLTDAPCSGSGSWRRSPAGKWALTTDRLSELTRIQGEILRATQSLVSKDGILAYATCSVLEVENAAVIDDFLAEMPNWELRFQKTWMVSQASDGFFSSHLRRKAE